MPKVSIILPTYNGERYLAKAIKSVLRQRFTDWELLVIDDGSVKQNEKGEVLVREIVRRFTAINNRIKYLRNDQNLGIQKSLNRGLREAQGEYIARIDDDDEWADEEKLEKQVEFLDKNPDYVLVGTGTVVVNERGEELFRFLNPETDEEIRRKILSRNCFSHSSVMFRRSAAERVGNYPEEKKALHVEDYFLWLKLGKLGKFYNLPFYGIKFMVRPGAIGSKHKLRQFWHDILLVWQFRKDYPNFFLGFLRSWLRFILYGLFGFIPLWRLRYWMMKKEKRT